MSTTQNPGVKEPGESLDALHCELLGTSLIEASAGTGKTHAITTLFVRLLLERKLQVDQILVVTYTRAATAELRDRIRKRLRSALRAIELGSDCGDVEMSALAKARAEDGDNEEDRKRLVMALRSFDQSSIFTIHGFCQRVLQDSAFESGAEFDTAFIGDESELVAEIVNDFWARNMYGAEPSLVRFLMGAKPAINPKNLASLARKVTQNPRMPVVPEVDDQAISELALSWDRARAEAAANWAANRDEITALLDGNSALGKGQYKPGQASGPWAASMDQCLAEGQLGISADFDKFVKFTSSGIAKGTKKNCTQPEHSFFENCDALAAISSQLGLVAVSMNQKLVAYARTELAARKRSLALQSYDDLLLRLAKALEGTGAARLAETIRTRFPGALIDEFQDTDPMQYQIFERVYAPPASAISLFLIGDPKQAIYAFRGADVFAYMKARSHVGDNRHSMGTNWRSDPSLIKAVNTIFQAPEQSFVFDAIEFESVEHREGAGQCLEGTSDPAALQIVYVEREGRAGRGGFITKGWADQHLPRMTARAIAELLASEASITPPPSSADEAPAAGALVRPGDIAVLVRKNAQAAAMQEALRELGVPSVVESDASVFECQEALELERILQAMANPSHQRSLVAALTTTILGVRGDKVHELRSQEEGWEEWLHKFRRWHGRWQESGFIQAFRMMLSEEGVPQRLLVVIGGERRLTNLYHLGELLQAEASNSQLGAVALVQWMNRMRNDAAARSEELGDTGAMRLESDADAVKLVTIHKSKGLEYPIVYCPFMWDGTLLFKSDKDAIRFHDPDADNQLVLDIGSEEIGEHRGLAEREAMAENLRLFYVAVTRAKHQCTLIWGGFTEGETSPLAYLWHREAGAETSVVGLQAIQKRVKAMDDAERLADLHALCERSDGTISVRVWQEQEAQPYSEQDPAQQKLRALKAKRELRALGRFSSFSALVSGGRSEGQERDTDQSAASVALPQADDTRLPEEETAEVLSAEVLLAEFPRGARVGVMMHEVFEHTDFSDEGGESLKAATEEAFARYGISENPEERFLPAMQGALATPLVSGRVAHAPRLCEIEQGARLDELEFLFPAGAGKSALRASEIAAVLKSHPNAPWPSSYPAEVAKIDFAPLKGYMRGFVDLIFCKQGRYYLADYKSNFLGPQVSDYSSPSLVLSMASHHYFLQYMVYIVALHRYLQYRLPDYDYEQHMGGVFYLFVRGMGPNNPEGTGVFGDLPPRSLVNALSDLFAGVRASAGAAS